MISILFHLLSCKILQVIYIEAHCTESISAFGNVIVLDSQLESGNFSCLNVQCQVYLQLLFGDLKYFSPDNVCFHAPQMI